MAELTLGAIAERAGARLVGDPERIVRGVAPLDQAGPDDVSFLANARYASQLESTAAGAVLIGERVECVVPGGVAALHVGDPYVVLRWLLPALHPEEAPEPGIDASAVVAPDAVLGEDIRIEPFATIGAGAVIGARVHVGAHAAVGDGCRIGADTVLHPHVTLYRRVVVGERCVVHGGARLGADGFGFVFEGGAHKKIPQVGGCRIEDDVEIGANTTIDRGSIGDTVIGSGTKIDNLVQIGHNCRIGRHVIIVSQVGISGSTTVGDGAVLGGQVGVQGHIRIGAGARIGGQAGVFGDVPDGATVSGYPARPHREALRAQAALGKLPELIQQVRRLERLAAPGDAHHTARESGPQT